MTRDVDDLYRELSAKGAIIVSQPADKPWGFREMAVATPEGHRMMFAQPIELLSAAANRASDLP
jgi:uncharacterized glyoxalase superfamily protein PhnB